LQFNKRADDGSGKCSISPVNGSVSSLASGVLSDAISPVIGVVYSMPLSEKSVLDECESLGAGYEILELEVVSGATHYQVFTYCAQEPWIDDSLIPYDWYKALVLTGAMGFNLPQSYIDDLERQASMPDADLQRAALHRGIVDKLKTFS